MFSYVTFFVRKKTPNSYDLWRLKMTGPMPHHHSWVLFLLYFSWFSLIFSNSHECSMKHIDFMENRIFLGKRRQNMYDGNIHCCRKLLWLITSADSLKPANSLFGKGINICGCVCMCVLAYARVCTCVCVFFFFLLFFFLLRGQDCIKRA